MEIKEISKTLKQYAFIFNCSYKTAWEQYINPVIRDSVNFEYVLKEMKKK